MKRLFIYSFYDNDGIVDDYVLYFLEKFKPFCEEIYTVVNGSLTDDSRKKLEKSSSVVLERENVGFDSAAFKFVIEHFGYEKLKEYDELILANSTMFGPIYSPAVLFDSMEKKDCDFWGITKHPEMNSYKAGVKVCEHIQSYFLTFNNKILKSDAFKEFWTTLKIASNYDEAIAFFELKLTTFFEDKGFKSGCYISPEKYFEKQKNLTYFYYILQQVKEDKMPFIKRKIFYVGGPKIPNGIDGGTIPLLKYIQDNTDYDVNLIMKNVYRTGLSKISESKITKEMIRFFISKFLYITKQKRRHYIDKEIVAREMLYYKRKYKNLFGNSK